MSLEGSTLDKLDKERVILEEEFSNTDYRNIDERKRILYVIERLDYFIMQEFSSSIIHNSRIPYLYFSS